MNDSFEPPDLLLQLGNVFVPVGKDGLSMPWDHLAGLRCSWGRMYTHNTLKCKENNQKDSRIFQTRMALHLHGVESFKEPRKLTRSQAPKPAPWTRAKRSDAFPIASATGKTRCDPSREF